MELPLHQLCFFFIYIYTLSKAFWCVRACRLNNNKNLKSTAHLNCDGTYHLACVVNWKFLCKLFMQMPTLVERSNRKKSINQIKICATLEKFWHISETAHQIHHPSTLTAHPEFKLLKYIWHDASIAIMNSCVIFSCHRVAGVDSIIYFTKNHLKNGELEAENQKRKMVFSRLSITFISMICTITSSAKA